ncbi:MAG: nicotinamide mononucleotide transporter [Ruminococcaceae bacterium]|nr:nicotinamide mononucleotide transporter [Oscillospiraceae bacterium]
MRKILNYFTKFEWSLLGSSLFLILLCQTFSRSGFLNLLASLVGAVSLIFNAKGNPIGQALMVIFSIFYGIISLECRYYGEMITYLGMTGPMAVIALCSWLKNPYRGNKAEVAVNRLNLSETVFLIVLSIIVTTVFFFILKAFATANLLFSTVSVTTSFIAVYLTFRRSSFFALAYAANDIVLIILWVSAVLKDISYLSVVVCFSVFLVNDLYGFYSWLRMQKRQTEDRLGSANI